MTTVTENDLRELKEFLVGQFQQINARFEKIDARFEKIDGRLEKIDARFTELDQKITSIDRKFEIHATRTEEKLKAIDARIDTVNQLVNKLDETRDKQIWALITVLSGTVLTVALRFFFTGNNP